MKYKLATCLLSLFLLSANVYADEINDRATIQYQTNQWFAESKFQELEKLASNYRESQERTSSGLWKLTLYYSGISSISHTLNNDDQWNTALQKTKQWQETLANDPAAVITHANLLIDRAWSYRGNSMAKNVKPENWKPFKHYIAEAREHLERHKATASTDPHWYATMLTIARAEAWPLETFLQLMNEGSSRHPYYYQIYFTGLSYLTPKWHGDKSKIEAFANATVEKTKHKEKMGMYARVYWVASQVQYGSALFTQSSVIWSKMKQGIKDVVEQYPDQWNINNFAYFSCLAKDQTTTRQLIKQIQTPIIRGVWRKNEIYQMCRDWANKGII